MAGHPHPRKRLQPEDRSRKGRGNGDAGEAAQFLASHLTDLAVLARRNGFDTLAYLLDMAKLEADEMLRHASDGRRTGT